MSFRSLDSEPCLHGPFNMPGNDCVPNGSQAQSHSRNNSNTSLQPLYRGGASLSKSPPKMNTTSHTRQDAGPSSTYATPSAPVTQRRSSNSDSKRMTALASASKLETFLSKRGRGIISAAYGLPVLWLADQEPPINEQTLGELDLGKLYDCWYLRHDLNFDRDIQFSPRGASLIGGKEKQIETRRYWDAVEIELALYASFQEDLPLNLYPGSLLDAHCAMPPPRSLTNVPQRLESMIQAIGQIVKTLTPPTKQAAVELRFNSSLFMQELEHGQCDIEDLISWVGALLMESCAPSRDERIRYMIETVSQGSRNRDPHRLRLGLQDLFCILETMKLDAANYQLQLLREFMISRFIEDERSQIISRMQNGWEVSNWLGVKDRSKSPFSTFTTNLISLITQPPYFLPAALALDHVRIQKFQIAFQQLTFRSSCWLALSLSLRYLGFTGSAPASSKDHIASLFSATEQDVGLNTIEQREALVLGIASHAYQLCAKKWLPSQEVLCHIRNALQHHRSINSPHPTYNNNNNNDNNNNSTSLSIQLSKLVHSELATVQNMDTVQLAHRYTSDPSRSRKTTMQPPVQQGSLEDLARKITHIALLHWRVWAPILYLSSDENKEVEGGEERERRRRRRNDDVRSLSPLS